MTLRKSLSVFRVPIRKWPKSKAAWILEDKHQDITVNHKVCVSAMLVQQCQLKRPVYYGDISPLDTVSSLITAEDFPSRTAFVQKVVSRGRAQRLSYLDK